MSLLDKYLGRLKENKTQLDNEKRYFIYALWNEGEVVYIGQTTNIRRRIDAHIKTKTIDEYSCFECDNHMELDRVESYLIGKLKPKHNKTLGSGMISLQEVRGKIRELSEAHKYTREYYVNNLRKIAKNQDIELIGYGGRDYVHHEDGEFLFEYAKERGVKNG